MTTLQAVNKMLRYVGELPVPPTVNIDELPDGHEAKTALEILDETNKELQEISWWFNTEDWTFIPDNDGYITLPTTIISIKSTTTSNSYKIDGGDLYDINNQTKIFTSNVTLTTIFEKEFENVPDIFQTYVLYNAAKHLHEYLNGDSQVAQNLSQKIMEQFIKVDRENMANRKYNLIKNSRLIDRSRNPSPL